MILRKGPILLMLLVLLFSCSKEPVSLKVMPDVINKGETARKTLLVYMIAENSLNDYATLDINEIVEAVPSIPRDCRLFVYVDDKGFPMLTQYFRMSNGEVGNSNFLLFNEDVCSSDTAVLATVLDYIIKDYPTETLDLVMWSHASGWLRGPLNSALQRSVGIDNGNNSFSDNITTTIEIEELAALLGRLPVKVNRLMYDACFMQGVESAFALRNAAEWIIASPAEIPGDGACYSTMVPHFFSSDGPVEIIDAYIKAYEKESCGAVLSAVHAPFMQNLADITYSYVIKYFNTGKKRDYVHIFSYLPGGKYNASPAFPAFFDINAVMKRYLTASEYAHWSHALRMALPYVSYSPEWYSALCYRSILYDDSVACGLSLYMPQNNARNEKLNSDFRSTEWYSAAGWQAAGW
ncbi:MAG: hypothetical protein IKJ97_07330 [Bacteroidaceae bacterium]|nr:hypothetical protein [Bacteroidaceae bacterium]